MPTANSEYRTLSQPSHLWIDELPAEIAQVGFSKSNETTSNSSLEYLQTNASYTNEFVGRSKALRKVLQQIEMVAPTDSTVLILGETGTGKELVARAVHSISRRRNHTFAKLNCAAIPSGLLESELFGHEKGSFTGAIARRVGRFEIANNGSLFLDEIGDFSSTLQPKLLRVLQEKEFERVGSNRSQAVDVRCNHDLFRGLRLAASFVRRVYKSRVNKQERPYLIGASGFWLRPITAFDPI